MKSLFGKEESYKSEIPVVGHSMGKPVFTMRDTRECQSARKMQSELGGEDEWYVRSLFRVLGNNEGEGCQEIPRATERKRGIPAYGMILLPRESTREGRMNTGAMCRMTSGSGMDATGPNNEVLGNQ